MSLERTNRIKHIFRLIIVSTSSCIALLIAETYLNFFDNYKGNPISVINGVVNDGRDTFRVLIDYLSEGKEIYPSAFPAWTLKYVSVNKSDALLPLGGVSSVFTALGSDSNKFIVYQSDRFGFYNHDAVWDRNPPILLIGDSFAQSSYVSEEDTLASVLTRDFAPTLSLGMSANGPLLTYASLREYGEFLKPKIIVWVYSELNNLHKLEEELNDPFIKQYSNPDFKQYLVSKQSLADNFLKYILKNESLYQLALNAAKTNSHFSSIIRLRNIRAKINKVFHKREVQILEEKEATRQSAKINEFNLKHLETVLLNAQNECSKWGGQLIFVYNTSWERYHPGSQAQQQRDDVLKLLNNMNIRVIDMHDLWSSLPEPLNFFSSKVHTCHFNTLGYAKMAQYIGEYIRKNKLLEKSTLKGNNAEPIN